MDKLSDNKEWVSTPDTAIATASGEHPVPQEPDQAEATDDPQAAAIPVHAVADQTQSDTARPADSGTFVGKRVFSPHELSQAGEDKEYFHPDKDHKFDAPNDANEHALTPDVEVTPDNTVKKID